MQNALNEGANSNIDANNGGGKPDKQAANSAMWDTVLADLNPSKSA